MTAITGEVEPKPTADAPSAEFLELISHDFARRHLVLSAGRNDGVERLIVSEDTPPDVVFNVGVRLGVRTTAQQAESEEIARRVDQAYEALQQDNNHSSLTEEFGLDPADVETLIADADRDLLSTGGKGPVVKLVDALLFEAVSRGASDLHIQPLPERVEVRMRVDGLLRTAHTLDPRLASGLVSRIKVMGRMDIAERRVPQDGRATVTVGSDRSIDLRISTLPTNHGERAVLRLLDNSAGRALYDLTRLGMPEEVQQRYLDRASRSNGIVLLSGPTGSGKTTTLYATLRWIAERGAGELNVMTVEDPIEYELSGHGVAISQSQVNTKKGVTFASGLRHILRQDPDVVMVGEIRDLETARIAIQASLTGHLVFSTIHTNDSASAVTRLVDLGIEPYLVGASLSAVLAQRLVRTVHRACNGAGCETCFGTGLLGRTGLFELLVVDERIGSLISDGASSAGLRAAARESGLHTLEEEGLRLIRDGVTTEAEIRRVASVGFA